MAILLVAVPLALAGGAFVMPSNRWRPWLLPLAAVIHLAMVGYVMLSGAPLAWGNWLVLDALGRMFLAFFSVLFLACALYTAPYLHHEHKRSNRVFCACSLVSLGMMSLVSLSHHLGLLWVAMEGTTLAMAPNIYFYHTGRSLEATWKYLLICSVGIALALLGSFFLGYSALHGGLHSTLFFDDLIKEAAQLSRPWLNAAFIFLLIGYGTKMGLAPMHTWLPDAHGEAPAPVSALLSGALLPCSFLAILRAYHICAAAGEGPFARSVLLVLGLVSMAVAGVFMAQQRDLKRLLAYSSVEHMGILALGIGVGGPLALYGTLLHVINNGLTKASLFLGAGNILHAYGSRELGKVTGVLRRLPLTGGLFLAGFFAITGSPPFGLFLSEFSILNGAFLAGRFVAASLMLVFLGIVFLGMGSAVLSVVQGPRPAETADEGFQDSLTTCGPILLCMGVVLLLGVYIPPPLDRLLHAAVKFLEVQP